MRSGERWRRLCNDLRWAGTKRLLRNAYRQARDADERDYPTLAEVVSNIVGKTEWRARPNLSLIETISDAIGDLPKLMMPRKAEDKSRLEPIPKGCLGKPERRIAEVLYGFADDELTAELGKQEFTYRDYLSRAKELAGLKPYQGETAKRMTRVIRQDLTDILLRMEQEAVARRQREPSPVSHSTDPPASDQPPHPSEPAPSQPPSLTIHLQHHPSNQELDTAVIELAKTVKHRLRAEQRLRRSPESPDFMPLRWVNVEEYVDRWEHIRGAPGQNEPVILDDTLSNIAATYAKVPSGRLVILGFPGSGKSTLAAELALALLENDTLRYNRVPVIFSLSTWNPAIQSLRDWMIDFLLLAYPLLFAAPERQELAKKLVYWDHVLPIFDGFDEIATEDQAYALQIFNTSFDHTDRFVLTSRPSEYFQAAFHGRVLAKAAVVKLEDLTPSDVIAYLPSPQWDWVAEGLSKDESDYDYWRASDVVEALNNPLMLSLTPIAYPNGRADQDVPHNHFAFPDFTNFRKQLFDQYIVTAYKRPPQDRDSIPVVPYPCSASQAQAWLGCIAAYMCGLRSLNLPAWDMQPFRAKVRDALSYSLLGRQQAPALIRRWSFNRDKYGEESKITWGAIGVSIIMGLHAGLLVLGYTWLFARHISLGNLRVASIAVPVMGLLFLASFSLVQPVWRKRPDHLHPMLPIRHSRLAKLPETMMLTVSCETVALFITWSTYGRITLNPLLVAPVTIVPFMSFLYNPPSTYWSAVGPHQFILILTGKLPRRRLDFLEDAYQRGVLRKNGGSYQFRHQIFQERLAEQWISSQPPRVAKSYRMRRAVRFIKDPYVDLPAPPGWEDWVDHINHIGF